MPEAGGSDRPRAYLDAAITVLCAPARLDGPGALTSNSAPARSTSSSPRCTGRPRPPSPTGCSTRWRTCWTSTRHTIKVGVMDEERRTSANLAATIHAVRGPHRLHQHGLPRPHGRRDPHLHARGADGPQGGDEDGRLDHGLRGAQRRHRPGLRHGRAGADRQGHVGDARPSWPTCWSTKIGHPRLGPTPPGCRRPTAATLHALHYHRGRRGRPPAASWPARRRARSTLEDLLTIPVADQGTQLVARRGAREVDNNAQGILGYVVRWVDSRAWAAPRCPTSTTWA